MVGEIRDKETAEMAIQAALTGHLVLSTLHTNDSAGAVTRLVDMGIEPFLVSSSLVAVVAQRLIRKLCNKCKRLCEPDLTELSAIRITDAGLLYAASIYKNVGCEECMDTGYFGRTAIYELLEVDDDIRKVVLHGGDSGTIRKEAQKNGMIDMIADGAGKVFQGITSVEEILRVAQEE